jgi:hypothetical protein
MSYTKEVTLWCDADDCQEWAQLNHHESNGGKVAAARISARRARWTTVGGKDYCQKHSTFIAKVAHDPLFDGPSVSLVELRAQHG